MPDNTGAPLPPLDNEAYDGTREEAAIHRDNPLPKTCTHKAVQIISGTELKCGCGVGWTGTNILELYKALSSQ